MTVVAVTFTNLVTVAIAALVAGLLVAVEVIAGVAVIVQG